MCDVHKRRNFSARRHDVESPSSVRLQQKQYHCLHDTATCHGSFTACAGHKAGSHSVVGYWSEPPLFSEDGQAVLGKVACPALSVDTDYHIPWAVGHLAPGRSSMKVTKKIYFNCIARTSPLGNRFCNYHTFCATQSLAHQKPYGQHG